MPADISMPTSASTKYGEISIRELIFMCNYSKNSKVEELLVVCLIMIDKDGYIFTAQRPPGKKLALHWEFPGGKIEPDEQPESALRREIKEELSLELGVLKKLPAISHEYDFARILLTPFLFCCKQRPTPTLSEHIDCSWVKPTALLDYIWAPADLPIVKHILDFGPFHE